MKKDIHFPQERYFKGKPLRFTRHIRGELDRENKTIDFLDEILKRGDHQLSSKRKNKYEAVLGVGKFEWILSYAEYEECIILIHLGKKRR